MLMFHSYVSLPEGSSWTGSSGQKMCAFQSTNIRMDMEYCLPKGDCCAKSADLLCRYFLVWKASRYPPKKKGWCKIFSSRPMPITVHVRFTPDHSRATSFGWRRCDIAPLRWKNMTEPQQESGKNVKSEAASRIHLFFCLKSELLSQTQILWGPGKPLP